MRQVRRLLVFVSVTLLRGTGCMEFDSGTADLSSASVVTIYIYPGANLRLRTTIMRHLKPGSGSFLTISPWQI